MKNKISDPNVWSNIPYIVGGIRTVTQNGIRGIALLLLGIVSSIHHYGNRNIIRYKIDIIMAYLAIITNCSYIVLKGITQGTLSGCIIIAISLPFFFAGRKHRTQNNNYYKAFHSTRHIVSAIGTIILLNQL